jgi:hypothetical protein
MGCYRAAILFTAAAAIAGGCQAGDSRPASAGRPDVQITDSRGVSSADMASPDTVLEADPSFVRLNEIGGAIMLYWSINKQMPPQLVDAQTADPDEVLNFNSIPSGEPYAYVPAGLSAGGAKRIIVCDPEPGRDGKRWCLLMPQPAVGMALSVETVQIPEAIFERYSPLIQ